MQLAVLVPVKRFSAAKGRLAGVLTGDERAMLAMWMATRVLRVVAEIPTFVACDDDQVAQWATGHGAQVLWSAGLGLNGAVDDGVDELATRGYDHVVVSHADVPRCGALARLARPGCISLVPDRARDGTNAMSFPTAHRLRASYGGGSFARHLEQAESMGTIPVEVRIDADLSLDVDTAADLAHPLIRPLLDEVLPAWQQTNPANLASHPR